MFLPRSAAVARCLIAALVALCCALASVSVVAPAQAEAGTPSAPLNVTAKVGSGRTVTVTWTAPVDGGTSPIQNYIVTSSSADVGPAVVPASARSKKFDLAAVPATTFTFRVTAHNAIGDGPASAPSEQVTIPATAPEAPRSVTVAQSAPEDDPLVRWTPGSAGGSPITQATLTVQPGDLVIAVEGDLTEVSVPDLTPGVRYTFAVILSNAVGNSRPTFAEPFTPWAAPGPVGTVKAVRGYQSAQLTWTRAATRGRALSAYRITVQPGGGSFTVPGTTTAAKLTGLQNGTRYTAEVAPVIGARTFPGTISSGFVPAGNPGPPYVLSVKAGRGKVTVKWNAAFTGGDPVRRYALQASNGVKITNLGPGVRQYTLTKLRKGTMIKFRMRSFNGVGPSPWGAWTQTVKVR